MGHNQKSAQKSHRDQGRSGVDGWGQQGIWRRSWFQSQMCQDYAPDLCRGPSRAGGRGKGSQQSSRWAKQELGENTAHAGAAEVQNTALITCGRLEELPQHH